MQLNLAKKRTIAKTALVFTVLIWGGGFVYTQILLNCGLPPSLVNAIRFAFTTLFLCVAFFKHLKVEKNLLLLCIVGGVLLFGGFMLQLSALLFTTPAYNGFFTASYIIFVPFILWIAFKKRPTLLIIFGVVIAIVGFYILNFGADIDGQISDTEKNVMLGNLLTIGAALFFAIQIVLGDHVLNVKGIDVLAFIFWQSLVASILFVAYFFIFEFSPADLQAANWKDAIFPLCFVTILGTSFAYPAQVNAQKFIAPSETSVILSAEALAGTVFSILAGFDVFSWHIVVGGLLVMLSIFLVQVLPEWKKNK